MFARLVPASLLIVALTNPVGAEPPPGGAYTLERRTPAFSGAASSDRSFGRSTRKLIEDFKNIRIEYTANGLRVNGVEWTIVKVDDHGVFANSPTSPPKT